MNFPAFSFPHLPGRNDPCWCGSGRKYKSCHCAFDQQIASLAAQGHIVPTHKMIKTPEQIEKIKESCKINIAVLDEIGKQIHEGMTTAEIDDIVSTMTRDMGGIPAPLNYEGYPYSVCTSVNDQVCHGFPSKHVVLKSGDIINVDCSTILNGYFSDSSRMYCIGDVSDENRKLVQVTKECVELGLAQVKPWGFLGDVGQAVNDHARANGYRVVREIGGHGCGLEFHEDPWVSYVTKRGHGNGARSRHDFHHRADGQYGYGRGWDASGQHMGNLHGGRQTVGAMGNHGACDGYGSRSAVLVSGFTAYSEKSLHHANGAGIFLCLQ